MAKLLSVTEFRQRAGITGTAEDLAINLLIEDVSARIQSYLGRDLLRTAYVDELHKPGGFSVFVDNPPIDTAVTFTLKEESPFIDGIIFPAPITILSEPKTFDKNEFTIEAVKGKISLKFREFTPHTFPSILITYTGGFAKSGTGADETLAVPVELKRATYMQSFYEHKHKDEIGLAGVSMAGASITLAPAELLPDVKQILNRFSGLWMAG